MSDPRPPQDETTVEEIETPAWDRAQPVPEGPAPAAAPVAGAAPSRGRPGVRWLVALVGVIVVAAGSALIVSLAGARPAQSIGLGYMPTTVVSYVEARIDLPGDQRQKLASFLSPFPGFKDQSAVEPKITDILDRIVRSASDGKQSWSTDIQPWFGGQLSMGQGLPGGKSDAASPAVTVAGSEPVVVATITDRAKAEAWLTSLAGSQMTKSTYNGADLFGMEGSSAGSGAVAVTDSVMIGGGEAAVKAAVDSGGKGALAQDADVKAALATVDRDYVMLTVMRTRAYVDGMVGLMAASSPGTLDSTRLDDTIIGMLPAWQAGTLRFENDALVASSANPAWSIGYDAANRASALAGHVPAKTILYVDSHDIGPSLTAVLAKFRALPETKTFFDQLDQTLSVVGGFDAAIGWWGDAAVAIAPNADGTFGGGLVVKPRDAAAAERLVTTLRGYLALAGGSSGITTRDEDHNGTKITVLDFSTVPGFTPQSMPPGYKAEIAVATNADVTVLGYGRDFVAAVLDAGPGSSLADDARFKSLVSRVGAENLSLSFVDIAAIRVAAETALKPTIPAAQWSQYEKDYRPYLLPLDAAVQSLRKDGGVDRASGAFTVH